MTRGSGGMGYPHPHGAIFSDLRVTRVIIIANSVFRAADGLVVKRNEKCRLVFFYFSIKALVVEIWGSGYGALVVPRPKNELFTVKA
jgi:hypothetical protein